MSITYIAQSQAKPEKIDSFRTFLTSTLAPVVQASQGCESCQVLQSLDDPTRFVLIEVWTSVETHQASIESGPKELFGEAMKLMASPPSGRYYHNP